MVEKGKQAAGEDQGRKPWTLRKVGGKTVWDWMELLIVPLALGLATLAFSYLQSYQQQRVEEQRAQDEALQAYLGRMNTLIFEEDLLYSEEGSAVRMLARAHTLTILERIDPARRSAVLQFLVESDLVNAKNNAEPIISLADADLEGAEMFAPNLRSADLRNANLENAKLRQANLKNANLDKANWLSNEEIEQQVYSLKGATMPDGQTYEEWLKTRGEDGG